MGRVSSLLLLLLAVIASSVVTARGDDPSWFPGWGWGWSPPPPAATPPPLFPAPNSPSPYYDAPPYDTPPSTPDAPSPYYDSPPSDAPSTPDSPSPYYDAPPYDAPPPPDASSPYYDAPPYDAPPPVAYNFELKSAAPTYFDGAPSYSGGPAGAPDFTVPWLSSSVWAENTNNWPAPYSPDTTIEEAFGSDAEQVYGQTSMLDGLSSKGDDGFSTLLKQGITSLLNAADEHYKYSQDEVKKSFSFKTALSSESAAAMQAHTFQDANDEYDNSHA